MLPNIPRSNGNETIKFRQLIEYNIRNIFLQKSCRHETERLDPDIIFLKKSLDEVNAMVSTLVSLYFVSL